jgi:hypothetical protein
MHRPTLSTILKVLYLAIALFKFHERNCDNCRISVQETARCGLEIAGSPQSILLRRAQDAYEPEAALTTSEEEGFTRR